MDDLISRQAAIDAMDSLDYFGPNSVCRVLMELPSVQPDLDSAYTEGYTAAESKYRKMWDEMPKIILCKDCKHADEYCHCSYTTWWNSHNDFCSKGRREKTVRTFTKEELAEILERHLHWLREDCDGWEDMRANLSSANLSSANLSSANLRSADLRYANLRYANLSSANLSSADLRYANLSYANLRYANLSSANLSSADLSSAKNAYYPIACPDTGSFIGWKKDGTGKYIIKLLIPEDAKRLSATGRKCRCDKAQVLAIENLDGTPSEKTETYSQNDNHFIYRIGETVTPEKPFCEDRWKECSSGIHFFINRQEAVNY